MDFILSACLNSDQTPVQVLSIHMWLMAAILDRLGMLVEVWFKGIREEWVKEQASV